MDGANGNLDLQSILATLAQFVPPGQTAEPTENAASITTSASLVQAPFEHHESTLPLPQAIEKAEDPRLKPQNCSATTSPKPIDPATITTWQSGLRCVTKIAAQNAHFADSIRRMMADQRKHEMQWYSERQNLKKTQANRASSAAEAQTILQSLSHGGGIAPTSTRAVLDPDVELAQFDRKTYAAQQNMEIAMTAELKGLGVPFFGTDRSLVVSGEDTTFVDRPSDSQPKWSPSVTGTQLLELRRRMVGHLEDLYGDG